MPRYSSASTARLLTCHPMIQRVMTAVILHFDNSIIWGHRGEQAQNAAFASGFSKKKWQESLHNFFPAFAVDAVPWPEMWEDRDRLIYFGGFVMGEAEQLGIPLIWGGDWNKNWTMKDEKWEDLAHFQLDVLALGIDLSKHRTPDGMLAVEV